MPLVRPAARGRARLCPSAMPLDPSKPNSRRAAARSRWAPLALLLLASARAAGQEPAEPRAQPPNIILFLVDDMGWQDTSVAFGAQRTPLNEHFRTPNMERLAASGVSFLQAYSCAVCSPSRTSLMTGQNAARHKVTQWTLSGADPSGKTERLESPADWHVQGLQPGVPTLPARLCAAGYRTIHVGKAHWGVVGSPGSDPRALGFQRNIAGHAAGAPGSYRGEDGFGRANPTWAVPGLESFHGLPVHLTDALTVRAIDEVEEAVAAGLPFYLYMAHYAVHAPIQPHEPYSEAYRQAGDDEPEASYAGMIEGMDASLGALLEAVERLGVAERTIVVFTSDNGGLSVHSRGRTPMDTLGDVHNWPLRGGKGSAYEGGTRVPLIVSWARARPESAAQRALVVPAGARRTTPTMIEDLFPTLLRWGGVESPADPELDGRDLTPLLSAEDGERGRERALLFHYPHVWGPKGPGYEPHSALRLGDWKLIYFYQPRRFELYDLAHDLGEEHDLAAAQPERLRALAARMRQELESRGAQWPTRRQTRAPEPPVWP